MSFTKKQQGYYRPMVNAAWLRHAPANGLDPKNKTAKEEWYREELLSGLGVKTSIDLDSGRDFNLAMAHFEAICGDDIYWQMRLNQADEARIRHDVQEICATWDIDDDYIHSTAEKLLHREIKSLKDLTRRELFKVRVALIKHARRLQRGQSVDCPF